MPKHLLPNACSARNDQEIRKVSNFDQTTTQNEQTFCKGDRSLGGERSMPNPSATFKLSDRHLLAHYWRMGGN